MSGGYREGSGRAKTGYYKGIYCGSTYELCWVIYAIDHNIGFTRFPKKLTLNGVNYIPDFLLDDAKTIIETKGYELSDSVQRKVEVAEHHGYKVLVLRKDDLKFAFDYVNLKHPGAKHKYHTLYDEYKPKFSHICEFCLNEFMTDNKTSKFCNRSCSGKFRSLHNHTPEVHAKISNKLKQNSFCSDTKYVRNVKQMWITDETRDHKVLVSDTIPPGFRRGRKRNIS